MTVTLQLTLEIEAGVLARARAGGVSVEEYLLSMVEDQVSAAPFQVLSPQERAAGFEAWARQHRPTPLLSDYDVSREAMYEGRDG